METIPLYQAIHEMRELTKRSVPFSFSFMSYSKQTGRSAGRTVVNQGLLRKATASEVNIYAEEQLNYFDVDRKENRTCWQCLLLTFNGKRVILT